MVFKIVIKPIVILDVEEAILLLPEETCWIR
jgi:hypothetical protein